MLVVKCGGAAGVDLEAVAGDIRGLRDDGQEMILVHGGSHEADELGARLGMAKRYLNSPGGVKSRYTDAATLDVITMAMAGRVNPSFVARLESLGVPAVGLAGIDGGVIRAKRKAALKTVEEGRTMIVRDDRTGRVTGVNGELLALLVEAGYVPVLSPPALDPAEGPLNVDADGAAAAVAVAVRADCLVILTNMPGLLRNPDDPASLVREVPPGGMAECLQWAQGRMKPKLSAVSAALSGGVKLAVLGDGRLPSPVSRALAGAGTLFRPDALGKGDVG